MSNAPQVRFPGPTNRTLVVGSTGSGKTRFGIWLLSLRDFTRERWIVFDYKRDDLIEQLLDEEKATVWTLRQGVPRKPGLYVVQPVPESDDAEVIAFLWQVWKAGKTGLYFDEGYMIPKSPALNAILTQGRSKKIPVITLAQRPVWLTRFAVSENEYYAIFRLNDKADQDTVKRFTVADLSSTRLPYHSVWYDVGANRAVTLAPVPNDAGILARFRGPSRPEKRRL